MGCSRVHTINLHPFCTVLSETKEMALYVGQCARCRSRKKLKPENNWEIAYRGSSSFELIPEKIVGLRKYLQEVGLSPPLSRGNLNALVIIEQFRSRTIYTLQELRGRSYFRDCFAPRSNLDEVYRMLLCHSSPTETERKVCLLIAGATGVGKTAWCCNAVEQLLEDNQNLVLFLRGDALLGEDLLKAVLREVGAEETAFSNFDEFLCHLNSEMSRWPGLWKRVVFILDAINEAPTAPEDMFWQALRLVDAAAKYSWIKVVITVSVGFLGSVRSRISPYAKDPLLLRKTFLINGVSPREPVFYLDRLTLGEAEAVYSQFREKLATHSTTPEWQRLSDNTKAVLRTPLLLYIFHRTFSRREYRGDFSSNRELFAAYVQSLLDTQPMLFRAVREVIPRMIEQNSPLLAANELAASDAVAALEQAGLLLKTTIEDDTCYRFVSEEVLEYLVFTVWQSENPNLSVRPLQALVEEGKRKNWAYVFWNAFFFVFRFLLENKRESDWLSLVNDESPAYLNQVAAVVWLEQAETFSGESPAFRVLEAFKSTEEARRWHAYRLAEFGDAAWRQGKLEHARLAYEYALYALKNAVLRAERRPQDLADLAVLHRNRGLVLMELGQTGYAEDFVQARSLMKEAAESDGKFKTSLARVSRESSAVLRRTGQYEAAIEICQEALGVLGSGDSSASREAVIELASLHSALGLAQIGAGKLKDADNAFQRALDILSGLGAQKAAEVIPLARPRREIDEERLAEFTLEECTDVGLELAQACYNRAVTCLCAWSCGQKSIRDLLDSILQLWAIFAILQTLASARLVKTRLRSEAKKLSGLMKDLIEGLCSEFASMHARLLMVSRRLASMATAPISTAGPWSLSGATFAHLAVISGGLPVRDTPLTRAHPQRQSERGPRAFDLHSSLSSEQSMPHMDGALPSLSRYALRSVKVYRSA